MLVVEESQIRALELKLVIVIVDIAHSPRCVQSGFQIENRRYVEGRPFEYMMELQRSIENLKIVSPKLSLGAMTVYSFPVEALGLILIVSFAMLGRY